jgi:hypothetical protein
MVSMPVRAFSSAAIAVPLLALRVQRLQQQSNAPGGVRVARVQQEQRARLVGHAGQPAEVGVRDIGVMQAGVGFAGEHQAHASGQRLEQFLAAGGELAGQDLGRRPPPCGGSDGGAGLATGDSGACHGGEG